MKKSFTIKIWHEDGMWYMDCDFLEICGEGITFLYALENFLYSFKGFAKYWKMLNSKNDSSEGTWEIKKETLKMKKRYKMVTQVTKNLKGKE